jgi:hypothetical protein
MTATALDDQVRDVAETVGDRLRVLVEECHECDVSPVEMLALFLRGIDWTVDEAQRWIRRTAKSRARLSEPIA